MNRLPVISALVLLFIGLSSGSILNSTSGEHPANVNSTEVFLLDSNDTAEVHFTTINTTAYEVETGVIDSSYGNNSVNVTGHVQVATPCHDLEHNLTQTGDNSYRLDITAVESMGSCVQVQAYTRYNAGVDGERPLNLEVTHNGETVSTLEDPVQEEENKVEEEKSVLDNIVTYLRQIFR